MKVLLDIDSKKMDEVLKSIDKLDINNVEIVKSDKDSIVNTGKELIAKSNKIKIYKVKTLKI